MIHSRICQTLQQEGYLDAIWAKVIGTREAALLNPDCPIEKLYFAMVQFGTRALEWKAGMDRLCQDGEWAYSFGQELYDQFKLRDPIPQADRIIVQTHSGGELEWYGFNIKGLRDRAALDRWLDLNGYQPQTDEDED